MNFEEAKRVALELRDDINHCYETEDAYIFSKDGDRFEIGGVGPVVVMKATGRATNMVDYTNKSNSPKKVAEFDFLEE